MKKLKKFAELTQRKQKLINSEDWMEMKSGNRIKLMASAARQSFILSLAGNQMKPMPRFHLLPFSFFHSSLFILISV